MNRAIMASLAGIGLAQALKVPLHYWQHGKWEPNRALTTGGMPSSHSAGVSALATYAACKSGWRSLEFGLSAVFGAIVMYDAMGIRRSAGQIAVEVNELDVEVERLMDEHPGIYHEEKRAQLNEQLGHLPREVLGGALLGAAVGLTSFMLEKKRAK